MKVSTRARYGARLMLELGLNYGGGPILLKDIAKMEEISEKYLSQIIIPLRLSHLVNSFRGVNGGYVLARPPEEITLREIVEALEGNFNFVDCIDEASPCNRISLCVTRGLWKRTGERMANYLESVKLSDLVKEIRKKKDDLVMCNI